jgi:hypothetical protein
MKIMIMKFSEIFKDDNNWNEKTVIGFLSFAMMVLTAMVDIVTGIVDVDFAIHEYIYNSFVIITVGSFGIAGLEKFAPSNRSKDTVNKDNT